MSYTKTNWHDGDTITAVKMNKIENGIESSLSDALVTLGKALCGDSFEVKPGLTDAETILEIAKNYTGGSGSESGGGRIIDLSQLDQRQEVDPESDDEDLIHYFSGYEAGLSAEDFINAWLKTAGDKLVPVLEVVDMVDVGGEVGLEFPESIKPSPRLYYISETGEFYYVRQGGGGGGK